MKNRIPSAYIYCTNSNCPKAKDCLRLFSYENFTENEVSINVLNPRFHEKGETCTYFQAKEKIKVAWGLKNALESLPYNSCNLIKRTLRAAFGDTKFYRFFRGELPLMPEEQNIVSEIFSQNGITSSPIYERFIETYAW